MHCSAGNVTDPIWRVLDSSDGISSWTPLKPQHSNPSPNPNPLANQLWCIDFLTPPTPLIIPHRLPGFLESLMPLKNSCSIYARWSKSSLKHFIRFCRILPSLKQNFIAYHSFKVSSHPDCIFEIHQLWQSGFSRVYSNCCCRCSFEAEIIKIGQSSHKMYSNNIVNFQESTTILDSCTKKVWKLCTSPQLLPCHRLFDQDGLPQPPYSPDLTPCDFWSFPKLRVCRYETIEEMKEAVTKVIDTLTQPDFRGAFQESLETYLMILVYECVDVAKRLSPEEVRTPFTF